MFFPYRIESDIEKVPIATYVLLAANALIFGVLLLVPNDYLVLLMHRFGCSPEDGRFGTFITHMFLHAGWLHFVGNMYYLWLFGRVLEQVMGTMKYVVFYFLAGIIAVMVHVSFVTPEIADVPCVGASGAISAILGGCLVAMPGTYIRCILMVGFRPLSFLRLRAYFVLGFWFILQLITQAVLSDMGGATGVAYSAHIGGFLFGVAVMGVARTVTSARSEWAQLQKEAALCGVVARINSGQSPEQADMQDPDVQRMLFLKKGVATAQELIAEWADGLARQSKVATAASIILRAHMSKPEVVLDGRTEAVCAGHLAKLGHLDLAVACLLDRLTTAEGEPAQHLLCEIGVIMWRDVGDTDTAKMCLSKAQTIDPDSGPGARATRVIARIEEDH